MNTLVEKAQKGDKEAFANLIRRYETSLYRAAKTILKNDDDAADAMQEAALSCWEKIGALRTPDYFGTWLMRILINKAKAIARRQRPITPISAFPDKGIEETGYAKVEWEEMLFELDEKYRMVVMLYYADEYKVREVADILGITQSAVKARLKTAREQMKKCYDFGKG